LSKVGCNILQHVISGVVDAAVCAAPYGEKYMEAAWHTLKRGCASCKQLLQEYPEENFEVGTGRSYAIWICTSPLSQRLCVFFYQGTLWQSRKLSRKMGSETPPGSAVLGAGIFSPPQYHLMILQGRPAVTGE